MVTILVVEDSSFMRKVLVGTLKEGGYTDVMSTSNAEEALERITQVKPTLMLIDFFLPGINGRQLCESIRADPKLSGIKIALLTSAEFSQQGEESLDGLGINDYIKKPIEKDDFLSRIKRILLSHEN